MAAAGATDIHKLSPATLLVPKLEFQNLADSVPETSISLTPVDSLGSCAKSAFEADLMHRDPLQMQSLIKLMSSTAGSNWLFEKALSAIAGNKVHQAADM